MTSVNDGKLAMACLVTCMVVPVYLHLQDWQVQWNETSRKYTSGFTCLSCPKMLEIILRRAELGENPSHGGT
jgi:hypothetical protein